MKAPRLVQFLAGIAIAAAGMWVFLRGADVRELAAELGSSNPWIILLCCVLTIFSLVLRTWRWRLILPKTETAHTRNLFSHTIIGFMVNNILPARIGEGVRAFLLWKHNGFTAAVSVGSLILERVIDMVFFLLFFAAPVLLLPGLKQLRTLGLGAIAIFACSVAFLALCARYPAIITRLVGALRHVTPRSFHPRISAIGTDFASVLDWTCSPSRLSGVLVLSVLTPLCYAVSLALMAENFRSFGILHGSFVLSFAVAGAAIPLAPGYVGTLHATMLQALLLLHVAHDHARALAVLFHAVGYVPVTLVGFIYFLRSDMSFARLSHMKKEMEE